MSGPDIRAVFDAIDRTWPAAETRDAGGFRVRRGLGGGGRVSAATCLGPGPRDIAAMEAVHAGWEQPARVMVRPWDNAGLDAALDARGYAPPEPTLALHAAVDALALPPPPITAFTVDWPPLAILRELWAEGGIGPARQTVMDRAAGPKVALLGRSHDRPAAAAFLALDGDIAMVHALTVRPAARRTGTARALMQAAALWSRERGARWLSVQVDARNTGALAFYAALGMGEGGHYHYRVRTGTAHP